MDSSDHIEDDERELEEAAEDASLSARNGSQWFARISRHPEALVSRWTKGLETFFLHNPCEVGYLWVYLFQSMHCLKLSFFAT